MLRARGGSVQRNDPNTNSLGVINLRGSNKSVHSRSTISSISNLIGDRRHETSDICCNNTTIQYHLRCRSNTTTIDRSCTAGPAFAEKLQSPALTPARSTSISISMHHVAPSHRPRPRPVEAHDPETVTTEQLVARAVASTPKLKIWRVT